MMTKKLLLGIGLNLLLFGSVLYTKNISVLLFLGAIYIGPAVVNLISSRLNKYQQPFYVLPLITTFIYGVVSYFLMQRAAFMDFVTMNSRNIGDLSIQINANLLGLGQLLFVFLINFGCIYLSYKLTRRNDYANS